MSKVWLITGSSRGLGRELAKAALAAGHRLVATARKPEDLSDLVAQYGDRVRAVALDVTDPSAARATVAAATSAFGRLDVVVNNAGYANVNSIEDMAEDDFRAQIETNFFGVVNVTRAALPVLRAQRDGHFIQISSIGGRRASLGISAYRRTSTAWWISPRRRLPSGWLGRGAELAAEKKLDTRQQAKGRCVRWLQRACGLADVHGHSGAGSEDARNEDAARAIFETRPKRRGAPACKGRAPALARMGNARLSR